MPTTHATQMLQSLRSLHQGSGLELRVHDLTALGLADYATAVAVMDALVQRPAHDPDVLLLLEHPPVATLGRKGGADQLRATQWTDANGRTVQVPVHAVARGGNVTMHAPGQLVGYPIVQLAQLAGPVGTGPFGDLPRYVRELEEALVTVCAQFGVACQQRPGYSGVWCSDTDKIASIGVGVRNGWAMHGFALNVDPPLALFELMVPCGLPGVRLTSLAAQCRGATPALSEVATAVSLELQRHLRRRSLAATGL